MSSDEQKEFTGWKAIFWPIHSYELKKFLPMAIMMMGILYNYSILRGIKDTLVVNNLGAEMIPTLKLYFVLPSAVLSMLFYSKLVNVLSRDGVFYTIVGIFIIYFSTIGCIFQFSDPELFHTKFHSDSAALQNVLDAIGSWIYSSFYVMAELWGSIMIGLMFWKFANDVTSIKESKRFYSMFGFVANGALIFSGMVLKTSNSTSAGGKGWEALPSIVSTVVIAGIIITAIYWWLNNRVLTDPRFFNRDEIKPKKKKEKLSLTESFKYIFSSKYLGFIALLIIGYGISINLVEVMWKKQVFIMCEGNKDMFSHFMGGLQIWTGIFTILCMIVGANVLRRCSWRTGALVTPVMIFITGLIFFGFIIFKDKLDECLMPLGIASVVVTAWIGLAQNVLSKGTKYSLFDPTKEMTYIPLDSELKSKGKAAVDVVGGRLGKSGGAFINWLLLTITGSSLVELAPAITVIFIAIMILWFISINGLNTQFLALTQGKTKEAAE